MRSLGLDIGDRRIGVALSDPEGILASPLTVINRRDEKLDIKAITDIVSQKQVEQIVVGLPLSMDGSLSERLTTVLAERLMQTVDTKKTGKKARHDAQAAALVLQGYLDEKHEP
jgi:putative Holliday junction resolvase